MAQKLWKPGQSGNPNGGSKKAGAKRKAWEQMQKAIIGRHTDKANAILEGMEGQEFLTHFGKLLEFFKPKLARAEVSGLDGKPLYTAPNFNIVVNGKEINFKANGSAQKADRVPKDGKRKPG